MAIASHAEWFSLLMNIIVSVVSFVSGHTIGKKSCGGNK